MAIPTRATSHGTFFISTQTYNRRRLFQVEANALLFLDTIQQYRREGHYRLHAFVVMPDHIHLLFTPQDITLERAMQLIKGGFSHRMKSTFTVWQRGFTDRRMRDLADLETHRHYIHHNPVRARVPAPGGLPILLRLPPAQPQCLKASACPVISTARTTYFVSCNAPRRGTASAVPSAPTFSVL